MSDKCKECGTDLNQVPFIECRTHHATREAEARNRDRHDQWVRDATTLDRLRGDMDLLAEELQHKAKHQTRQVTELMQLSTAAARLSYDLKSYLRAHKP